MRVDAGPESELREGEPMCATLATRPVALFRVGGKVYCLDNRCTHMGGPLCEGTVDATVVECPWHGSQFDVRTGQVVGPPARTPVRSYPAGVENGRIWVDLP
ncbi:MAG: non-heme iron oxygenase ferredoxin subunit [Methanobacteriota archaeon]|nr:MAG: non-heme iron oxygenase ferredoxin subunit [Euryarchaeota archaeon]